MSISASKGLANQPGENNCFLNCAVQALWHIDVFRESLRLLSGHRCTGPACIFCALKVTFTQLSYSGQQTLLPNILRKALAESFSAEQRFQLGNMDDSAECLDTILQRLHHHLCTAEDADVCSAPHCISHAKFGMNIQESSTCPNCSSNQFQRADAGEKYVQLIHYVPTDALVSQVRLHGGSRSSSFAELLRSASGDTRYCPNCGNLSSRLSRRLLSSSPVLILGLVWHAQQPTVSFLADVVESVSTELRSSELFDTGKESDILQLTALICYYGRHYSAFCRDNNQWLFFDDDVVRSVGQNWRSVVHRCVRGGYQPLLLLYTNPAASPVNVESALATTVRVSPTQLRREAAVSASSSSGSASRSRCPVLDEAVSPMEPCGDIAHSRSSSLSEENLLAGGNPHLHRRLSSPVPPPPPEFANSEVPPPNGALEFRRQGSYISAVTEAPRARSVPRRSDSLDSSAISPPISPGTSPARRRVSASSSSPPDSNKYIARQTVETVLQLQRQQAAYRRHAATAVKPASNDISNFATLPRRKCTNSAQDHSHQRATLQPIPGHQQPFQDHSSLHIQNSEHHPTSVQAKSQTIPSNQRSAAQPTSIGIPGQQRPINQQIQIQNKSYQHRVNQPPNQLTNQHAVHRSANQHVDQSSNQNAFSQLSSSENFNRPVLGLPVMNPAQQNRLSHFQRINQQSRHQNLMSQQSQQRQLTQEIQRQQQQNAQAERDALRNQSQQQSSQTLCNAQINDASQESHIVGHSVKHLSSHPSHLPNAHSQSEHIESQKKVIDGACPTCGIADSWTIDAGVCIRCNVKLTPRSSQPLKSALSGRTASISSMDSSASSSSVPSLSASGKPRKKKSVHFNEASLAPIERKPARVTLDEVCQLCQQRPVSSDNGPAYCSVCQVYLSRFVSQNR